MELRHLRYFVAVAEEGNVTRAAERLGIGQPPLSQQIHALERELDVKLFHRTGHGVVATDAGKALLPDAQSSIVLPLVVGKVQLGLFYADRTELAPEGVPPDETALIKALKGQVLAALAP